MTQICTVLLVEDDPFKSERITDLLGAQRQQLRLTEVSSVQGAVKELDKRSFDIVVLDIALPSHDLKPGGSPASSMLSGGVEVLMELAYLERPERVVVVTQYPEIELEGKLVPLREVPSLVQSLIGIQVAGVVLYEHDRREWEEALVRAMGL